MRHFTSVAFAGALLLTASLKANADDFVGTFHDNTIRVEIAPSAPGYAGTITLGAQRFPMTAKSQDGRLVGSFSSGGASFDFNAMLNVGKLTLESGGKTYVLDRDAPPPVNPLAAGAAPTGVTQSPAVAPPVASDAGVKLPPGYALVRSTPLGIAMTAPKANVTTVKAALDAALNDLDDYFDEDYDVYDSVEDQRDHKSGLAGIKAKFKGQAVKGIVAAHVGDKGSVVTVAFCKADATPADWGALVGAARPSAPSQPGAQPPSQQPADPRQAPAAEAAPQPVSLQEYRFPDGTGAIGVAPGWQMNAPTCQQPFEMVGPNGQHVSFGFSYSINTPDSTAVQLARQYPVPANASMLIAPICEPADAVKVLTPQVSRISQARGSFAIEVDNVTKLKDNPPIIPGTHAATVTYGITTTKNGERRHYQAMALVSVGVIGQGAWAMYSTVCYGPDATIKQDMPVMLAMVNSLKTNDALIAQKTGDQIAQSNANFNRQQEQHRELTATYDRYNESQRVNSIIRSRSNDDFDETIRGYRTVEDTKTGEQQSVNLGHVDEFVDEANRLDPGRYKQIPLRDEADPLPGNK